MHERLSEPLGEEVGISLLVVVEHAAVQQIAKVSEIVAPRFRDRQGQAADDIQS